MDWEALASRRIPAPFKPQIKSELDVSNFSEDFTSMAVALSPAAVPLDGAKIFKVTFADEFRQFVLSLIFICCFLSLCSASSWIHAEPKSGNSWNFKSKFSRSDISWKITLGMEKSEKVMENV